MASINPRSVFPWLGFPRDGLLRRGLSHPGSPPPGTPARGIARLGAPLVFTHIPKAAGTALIEAIEQALAPSRPLYGLDDVLFGAFEGFDGFSAFERARILLHPHDFPRDADFIAGHFSHTATRRAYPGATHVTIMREPVARLLSLWSYWRGQNDAALAGLGTWADSVRLSHLPLGPFLRRRDLACQTDNIAVRMLLHGHASIRPHDFIDPACDAMLLCAARRRLRDYRFLDIVEDTDMPVRLGAFLGVVLAMRRVNETPAMPETRRCDLVRELSPDTVRQIDRLSRLDRVLWETIAVARVGRKAAMLLQAQSHMRAVARHAVLLAGARPA